MAALTVLLALALRRMNGTPREYFRRRLRAIVAVIVIAWVLIPVAVLWWRNGPSTAHPVAALLFGLSALFVIGALVALVRIRCPACGEQLGDLGSQLLGLPRRARVDSCPHCGCHFDKPIADGARALRT
jgi:hypothetical protein